MNGGEGPGKKIVGISIKKLGKIITGSFLLIALIHIVVFTVIGLFTSAGWRLLWIFLGGLALMVLVVMPLKYLLKKRFQKKSTDK